MNISTGVAGETDFIFTFDGWMDEGSSPQRDPVEDKSAILLYEVLQNSQTKMPFVYTGGDYQFILWHELLCIIMILYIL